MALQLPHWNSYQKITFRFFFLYFLLQIIPWDGQLFRLLFAVPIHFKHWLDIASYVPSFGGSKWLDLLFTVAFSSAGSLVWSWQDAQRLHYRNELYWLRTILRYRLGFAVFSYGVYKLFLLQMPAPSISHLHTPYGDYLPWKIYYQTIGITPDYEMLLGLVEITAGLFLFFRSTTSFGVGLLLGFVGNILLVNFLYKAGDAPFAFFLFSSALFLFSYDVPRLVRLLILQQKTLAERFSPFFSPTLTKLRPVLKGSFAALIILIGLQAYSSASKDPFKIPKGPTLSHAVGYYQVRHFVYNQDTLPYSLSDSLRWQDVVIEKWPTISIKINRPLQFDDDKGEALSPHNIDRTYESSGVNGRHYFDYVPDTLAHTLELRNKNRHHRNEGFQLHYYQVNDSTLLLRGVNERNDSIVAILDKINKKYLLYETLRKPIKL